MRHNVTCTSTRSPTHVQQGSLHVNSCTLSTDLIRNHGESMVNINVGFAQQSLVISHVRGRVPCMKAAQSSLVTRMHVICIRRVYGIPVLVKWWLTPQAIKTDFLLAVPSCFHCLRVRSVAIVFSFSLCGNVDDISSCCFTFS